MAKLQKIEPSKTYATEANAVKAAEKLYAKFDDLRYFIMPTSDGRFFPVFIGRRAIELGVHFHFNVIG